MNLHRDVYYNILLASDDIINICYANKTLYNICKDVNFWKEKIKNDFNITIDIIPETVEKWIFLYNQIIKINDIYNNSAIKNIYFNFNPMDDVLYRVYDYFSDRDFNFIRTAEEYDRIKDQFIRIEYKPDFKTYIQYTEVGKKDYYTIYTELNKNKIINFMIIILYYFPEVDIKYITR